MKSVKASTFVLVFGWRRSCKMKIKKWSYEKFIKLLAVTLARFILQGRHIIPMLI